jgi:hypothetical protein
MKLWTRSVPSLGFALVLAIVTVAATPGLALEVPGSQVKSNTDRIMKSIEWSGNMDSLRARAQSERKLIFWLQLVGDLDDGL